MGQFWSRPQMDQFGSVSNRASTLTMTSRCWEVSYHCWAQQMWWMHYWWHSWFGLFNFDGKHDPVSAPSANINWEWFRWLCFILQQLLISFYITCKHQPRRMRNSEWLRPSRLSVSWSSLLFWCLVIKLTSIVRTSCTKLESLRLPLTLKRLICSSPASISMFGEMMRFDVHQDL